MVENTTPRSRYERLLSVLALSSRFDGRELIFAVHCPLQLSVLALSSRFDGPAVGGSCFSPNLAFQYSLCRVVLMVNFWPVW